MLCLEDNDRRIRSRVRKLRAAGADIRIHKGSVEGITAPDVSRLHFATSGRAWTKADLST